MVSPKMTFDNDRITNGHGAVPKENNSKAIQDVAIVGLACRFSGDATNPDKFWKLLCNGESGHGESPRFNPGGFSDSGVRKQNATATTHGHFLQQDVGAFDTNFFGITPEEASAMDPQQRLMMEVTYEAFENAGITMQQLAGSKTSCFIGNFTSDYREMIFRDADAGPRYSVTGTGVSMLANRISWFFDLRGPSVTINTACSSSLVALHLARRSLQSGEADIAIVGGSNLMLGPEMFTFFSNLNFLSRDGLSKSFDASGQGYGRGEGVAAIVLKRVDDAVNNHDLIRSVIRGTATNQDGKTASITLPSLDAQIDLIRSTYQEADLDFDDTMYFEAHGTGTRRGDPVELEAIAKTLSVNRKPHSELLVGSVKSNIGHTEATAGLAGIIKAVYILEKGIIPANIHYNTPLPEFDLKKAGMKIPVKSIPWPTEGLRRISINAFGFGGANAHAVLDDARSYLASHNCHGANHFTETEHPTNGHSKVINGKGKHNSSDTVMKELQFVFSAPDRQALKRYLEAMIEHFETTKLLDNKHQSRYLQDLAYTLSERRSKFKWRSVISATSIHELVDAMRNSLIKDAGIAEFADDGHTRDEKHDINAKSHKIRNPASKILSADFGHSNGVAGTEQPRMVTDLPSYPWDHSRTYWSESRMSKEFRLRKQPQRSLIGAPQPTFNQNERVWRGFLRLSEEPWVKDHQVLGSIIYPAAGYIAMAIEAARQIAEKGKVVSRFRLRDVQFHSAAIIKEETPLEWVIQIRPHLTSTRDISAYWQEFTVSTCHNEKDMRENCTGLLLIEYLTTGGSPQEMEHNYEESSIKEQHKHAVATCVTEQNPDILYQELASVGLTYGPAFQQISKIKKAQSLSSCTVNVYSPHHHLNQPEQQSHIIHPATLDCMIQTIFPALVGSHGRMQRAMVPTLLEEIIISAQTLTHEASQYHGHSTAEPHGIHEMVSNFAMLEHDTLKPMVIARGLRCAAVSGSTKPLHRQEENSDRNICSKLLWIPAPDLLSPAKRAQTVNQDIMVIEGDSPSSAALSDVLICQDVQELSYIPIPKRLLLSSLQDLDNKICVATLELGKSFLANPSPEDFVIFKEILRRCQSVLWISSGDDPAGSIVPGLARTLRNESAGLKFRTLQVLSETLGRPEDLVSVISQLVLSSCQDNEFRLEDGVLKVSRIIVDHDMDQSISSMIAEGEIAIEQRTIDGASQGLKLAHPPEGMLDNIYYDKDDIAREPLLEDEVEIEVRASGINFRDVLVMMGNVSDNLIGHECSGVVSRIGSKVTTFKKGDRVCTLGHGCHRSSFRNSARLVHKIPEGVSFEEAATIPLVYCTAYNAIVRVARAERGQTILIHAAAGGVGQAALQIANHLGLEVYATVGSPAKRELIKNTYGVREDHIFNSRDTSFAKGVMRMTFGRGVDIVLNSLAGEQLRQSWYCLAPFGTFVEIGIRDILANTRLDMKPFEQDATFAFFELINILHKQPILMAQLLDDVFKLLAERVIKPVTPVIGKSISEVGEALRMLQTGKHMGKVALVWDRQQHVRIAQTKTKPMLPDNATYVIVGGFGGLGRSIAKMLADRGARYLCMLSRSGPSSDALDLIQKLEGQGVKVQSIRCDVSKERSLKQAVDTIKSTMPAIRGIIQGAMVLRDVSFEKMTHSHWHEALKPKVDGSWNLHKLMPKELDFFIILSSFMGIFGSRTQGNYAAAGAYQDSLAHYRRSQGLKAVSLDLGLMRDVSAFSAQAAIGEFKSWQKPFGLREVEVHGLLDHVIVNEMTGSQSLPVQILTGFGSADDARNAGIQLPYYLDDVRFSSLADTTSVSEPTAAPTTTKVASNGDLLKQAGSLEEAADLVTDALIIKVCKVLERDDADIDPEEALYSYGVDSLVAIEIKNWIVKEFASDVSLLDIMAEEPVFDLAEKIASRSTFVSAVVAQG